MPVDFVYLINTFSSLFFNLDYLLTPQQLALMHLFFNNTKNVITLLNVK